MKKNILFICKWNRFRSKIAEALFNKYNKNKKYVAKSAGLIKGSPVDKFQQKVCKQKGILIKNPPRGLSTKLLKQQDIIILVANDVPKSIFKGNWENKQKLIVWKIEDSKEDNAKKVSEIVDSIDKKIKKFVKELK